jgi:hypothetical protein
MGELLVIVAALLFQSSADSLRDLARGQPQSDLVLEARARPMVVREAVAAALAANDFDQRHDMWRIKRISDHQSLREPHSGLQLRWRDAACA